MRPTFERSWLWLGRRKGNHVAEQEAGEPSTMIIMAHFSEVIGTLSMYGVVVVARNDQGGGLTRTVHPQKV